MAGMASSLKLNELEMKNRGAYWDCIHEHQSFRKNLAQSREKFIKQWMEDDLSKTVSNNSKQIKHMIESDKEKQKKICLEFEKAFQNSVCSKQALEERLRNLEALKTELQQLESQQESANRNRENASTELRGVEEKCTDLQYGIDSESKHAEEKLQALNMAGDMFQEMMCLQLKKTHGGKLQFIFKSIDEDDPERPFYFQVKIEGEERRYIVSGCEPPVTDMDELVKKLNDTDNLKSFVVVMRKRFKQMVSNKT
ncbi:hypothetical protein ScPMuIL_015819 [Solemya velum]